MNEKMKAYYQFCKNSNLGELKNLMEEDLPEDEKGFYKAIYEHFEEEEKQDTGEKMKEFYAFCKSSGLNELDSFTNGDMEQEERKFCIAVYEYFLQEKQKEIINGPFVI